jgi:hypothetical protein
MKNDRIYSVRNLILLSALLLTSCGGRMGNNGSSEYAGEDFLYQTMWTPQEANSWYAEQPWLIGTNFIPSTAISPVEMWQEMSYDPETIDRELGYANAIGMNTVRVFLHYLVWKEEGEQYLDRIDHFLGLAEKHDIGVMLVFFDDCWDPDPVYGVQKEPVPYMHNSGWVQCPGLEILTDTLQHDQLKPYVTEIMERFATDDRIIIWDLYNEPGNTNVVAYGDPEDKPEFSLVLLKKVFEWARKVDPAQPVTTGVWTGDWSDPDTLSPLNRFSLEHSDLISFHCYHDLEGFTDFYSPLERYSRPVICTEFMSRGSGGLFETILPFMKEHKIGGYNWGLVNGKTQTIYSWESWTRDVSDEAGFWHHDLLHKDGTPYQQSEIDLLLELKD